MIRRTLTTDTNILACFLAGLNGPGQQELHGRIPLIKQMRDNTGVTIQTQRELSQVVGSDREAIEMLKELISQQL